MARYDAAYVIEVGDANGDVAVLRVPAGHSDGTVAVDVYATNLAALVTALGAPGTITNGKVIRSGVTFLMTKAQLTAGTLPIDAEFPSVADKARLQFVNSAGGRAISAIPAPIEGIFHVPPSDDTVDPGSAVSAWITAFEANAADIAGNLLNLYNGGVRQKSRARRRKQHRL